jgi:hypothetical protein
MNSETLSLDKIDRRLLDDFQQGFPLSAKPYAEVGERLGIGEAEVLARLSRLTRAATASRRPGGTAMAARVLTPIRLGRSTGPTRLTAPAMVSRVRRARTSASPIPRRSPTSA